MPKFTREELEGFTIRQLRLIDINSVDDERVVQEILNKKMEAQTPGVDISDLTKQDITTPEQEAQIQAEIDARRAAAKERIRSNVTPGEAPEEDNSPIDEPVEDAPEANQVDDFIDHIVTEDDIINNPELSANDVKVGDVIQIPKNEEAPESVNCPECGRNLEKDKHKKKCSLNI